MHYLNHIWKLILGCFIAGALAVLPIVATVAIVIWVADFMLAYVGPDTYMGKVFTNIGIQFQPDSNAPYIFGWIVVLLFVFLLGVLVQLGAKSLFVDIGNQLFSRIPLIGKIYSTSQQLVEMIDQKDNEAIKGMSPVYYFFDSSKNNCVLALLVSSQKFKINEKEYYIIMIPTAPVPFGGAMLMVSVDQVQPADMKVDGLMSIYVSMGGSAKQYMQPDQAVDVVDDKPKPKKKPRKK